MTSPQPIDEDGAPEKPKRMPAKRLRQTLYWLALDWIQLSGALPTPPRGEGGRASNIKDYGHPAEWASDKARQIVDMVTSWHDLLAEQRNERRPTVGIVFGAKPHPKNPTPFSSRLESTQQDRIRLVAAWKYLEPRCEQLVGMVDADDLKELPDLHYGIRRTLGQNAPKYTLPMPCPNNECELLTLVRIQGVGQDFISCDACGYTIKDAHYPLLIRMALDAFLTSADTNEMIQKTRSTPMGELET